MGLLIRAPTGRVFAAQCGLGVLKRDVACAMAGPSVASDSSNDEEDSGSDSDQDDSDDADDDSSDWDDEDDDVSAHLGGSPALTHHPPVGV